MSITNRQVCHKYFYQKENGSIFNKSYSNVSYEENIFRSYDTAIGLLTKDKTGKDVLLVSIENLSNTTVKHIHYLVDACPHDVIEVPVNFGEYYLTIESIIREFKNSLEFWSSQKMIKKENRFKFSRYYEEARKFSDRINTLDFLDKYKSLYEVINNPDSLKNLRIKIAEREKVILKENKRRLENYLKNKNYLQLIKDTFGRGELPQKERENIRKVLNPFNQLAFVWIDENNFKTSKGITLPVVRGKVFLKLWKENKLKVGQYISHYKILEITKAFVRVGCHKIPTQNLEELCKELKV